MIDGLLRAVAASSGTVCDATAVDQAQLVRQATFHGVQLLLRQRATLTPATRSVLDEAHRASLVSTTQVLADLQVAGDALSGAGIAWVVVKGPVLAEAVWPQPATRPYGDLDLLVPPAALGDALVALRSAGARLLDRNLVLAREMGRGELTLVGSYGSCVDLHWQLVNDPRTRRLVHLSTEALLARRRPVSLAGFDAWALDPADALLHTATHAVLAGGHRLVWAVDVAASVRAGGFAWPEVLARARAAGAGTLLEVALHRAAQTLGLSARWPLRPWPALLRAYGARYPAGRPADEHPLGRTPFAATRVGVASSVRELVRLRRLGAGPTEAQLQEPHESPAELAAFLAAADGPQPVPVLQGCASVHSGVCGSTRRARWSRAVKPTVTGA